MITTNNFHLKAELFKACALYIDNRYLTAQNIINEIQEALTSETKSSAGDKHETGRAMLQLEREKAGNQLAEVLKIKEAFAKIDASKPSIKVSLGSVVFTSGSHYFIAISAGALKIENKSFFAISPNTPIGQVLLGKKVGDEINFRQNTFIIENIF